MSLPLAGHHGISRAHESPYETHPRAPFDLALEASTLDAVSQPAAPQSQMRLCGRWSSPSSGLEATWRLVRVEIGDGDGDGEPPPASEPARKVSPSPCLKRACGDGGDSVLQEEGRPKPSMKYAPTHNSRTTSLCVLAT